MAPAKRPWFRFYTEALTDPKVRRLTPEERWLWVAVLGAARQSPRPGWLMLTEALPLEFDDLAELAGMTVRRVQKGTDKMQDLGLISYDATSRAWNVPSWDSRQFESDDVAARTKKHRERNGDTPTMERSINGDSPSDGTPPETETETETEVTTSVAVATDAGRPDVEALCDHLANAVEANGSLRPTITDRWRTACRLMVDKDGRTPEQIRNAIDWSQADEFWRPNVMSMPKLREKYDQLRLAAQRSRPVARTEQAADGYRALREQMAQVDDLDGRALGEAS